MAKEGQPQPRTEQLNHLESAKEKMEFFVNEDFPGCDLEVYGPQIRQLLVLGRCDKRNWGKMTPLASGVSSANCRVGEDATNGTGTK
jgi:hypothetical protein